MTESTSSSPWDPKDTDETVLHLKKHKPSITRCRRELQSSFNAVKNIREPRSKARNIKESDVNHHFTYPRCSTCTDKVPGRLRRFAASVCNVCNVYLCTTCSREHRMNYNGHLVSPISPKSHVEENFVTRNGHRQPVCHEGHKDIPKYFCETCQDIVCLECVQTRHKKHLFLYAKDAYGKHKVALEKHIQNARAEADRIVKQLDQGIFNQFILLKIYTIRLNEHVECVYFRTVTLQFVCLCD